MSSQLEQAHPRTGAPPDNEDLSHEDRINMAKFNQGIWSSVKGNIPMPAPRHTVFPTPDTPSSAPTTEGDAADPDETSERQPR
jgi:hypothetical protein